MDNQAKFDVCIKFKTIALDGNKETRQLTPCFNLLFDYNCF